jgi:hypothetical protein
MRLKNGSKEPVQLGDMAHDYYSIWFNFNANFFISEEKSGS